MVAGVGEPTVGSPTSATIKGVAKTIQSSHAQKPSPEELSPAPPQASQINNLNQGGGVCHKLPTPVHPNKLLTYLEGYDCNLKTYLYDGFTQGFSLRSSKAQPQPPPKNLKSAHIYPHIVDQKLAKESQFGRIAGPFPEPPFQEMVFSPLGLQPKKIPGQFRVIHHLSHPKGFLVNDGIS